jgi:hypothetical protein
MPTLQQMPAPVCLSVQGWDESAAGQSRHATPVAPAPRGNARRGLLRRIWGDLFWFVLAVASAELGLAVAVESYLPKVRDPEYALKEERLKACRAAAPDHSLVLMLGSSRATTGFRAGVLGAILRDCRITVFNGALTGSGPMMESVCLRRLLASGIRPDLVFVEVVPLHFNQPDDGPPLEERILRGARLTHAEVSFLRPYCQESGYLEGQWRNARLLACARHRAELRDWLALDAFKSWAKHDDPLRRMDDHGWHPQEDDSSPADWRQATDRTCRRYAPFVRRFRLADQPARALAELLALCRREAIPVRLVLMPESSQFRSLYAPDVRAGIDEFLARLSRECQAPLIDGRDWVPDDEFRDGHHLRLPGAGTFTRRFWEEVLIPLVPTLTPRLSAPVKTSG